MQQQKEREEAVRLLGKRLVASLRYYFINHISEVFVKWLIELPQSP